MVRQCAYGADIQEKKGEGSEIMPVIDYLKDRRILTLIAIIAILAVLDALYGGPHILHFGIEFIGGTQIPITLAHPVNPDEMSSLISTLQQRISTYGLKEITIEGIGNSEIYVTIPSVSGSEINATISLIQSQGVFQGIVNGKEAINGSSILSGSIGAVPPTLSNGNVSWAVNFFITQKASEYFSKAVCGQANQPLYMFLDRPENAVVILNTSLLNSQTSAAITRSSEISAIENAVAFGNQTIPVEFMNPDMSNWGSIYSFLASHNSTYHKVITLSSLPQSAVSNLTRLNYSVMLMSKANMTPIFTVVALSPTVQKVVLDSWPAIGLLTSPTLSPGITNGSLSQSYQISGFAPPSMPSAEKVAYAQNQSKMISSILSGGALPVSVIVGQPEVTQAPLGKQILKLSGVAALLAVIAVAVVITVRYRKAFLIMPILLTTFAELFIIVSIIGLIGTIDLAAVAGMIAVVGTGVDAQIIITDEVLVGRKESAVKTRLGNAFYIVWADAALLIIAMMPLLFATSLVSIIGFSESTILGALLGVLITRPSYAAIVSKHYAGEANA